MASIRSHRSCSVTTDYADRSICIIENWFRKVVMQMLINTFTMGWSIVAGEKGFDFHCSIVHHHQWTTQINRMYSLNICVQSIDGISSKSGLNRISKCEVDRKCYRWHSEIIKFVPLNVGIEHEEKLKSRPLLIRLISITMSYVECPMRLFTFKSQLMSHRVIHISRSCRCCVFSFVWLL